MKLYFTSMLDTERWGARICTFTMSDHYIPLWKKAGIYDLLYETKKVTCKRAIPELICALLDMCVHYLDYRAAVTLSPSNDKDGGFMDELLREQVFRQACAILAMLIETASVHPHASICRQKEEGH